MGRISKKRYKKKTTKEPGDIRDFWRIVSRTKTGRKLKKQWFKKLKVKK